VCYTRDITKKKKMVQACFDSQRPLVGGFGVEWAVELKEGQPSETMKNQRDCLRQEKMGCSLLLLCLSGFLRLRECPGFFLKFPAPVKSWKMSLVLESPVH